jgi:hypothetical protein
VPRHVTRLVVDYFDYAACLGASACRAARHAARHAARRRLLRLAQARHRKLRLRRASRCLSSSRGSSHRSSPTTSPQLRVRVPQHVARLITRLVVDSFDYTARPGASACARLVAPLVVDYSALHMFVIDYSASHRPVVDYLASCGLVVDYFAYAARPGASTRRAARHAARRRLLHLCRASGCFGTSRGSSRGLSSTTSPPPRVRVPRHVARLVVDYFDYAACPGASACRAAHRAGSSSTTSPPPHVRMPRHVARLVTWLVAPLVVDYSASRRLVVDYFASTACPGASTRRVARHAACRAARS